MIQPSSGIVKKLKPSNFNEYLVGDDGLGLIYNNLSGALINVPQTFSDSISRGIIPEIPITAIIDLERANFLVAQDCDEIDLQKNSKNTQDAIHQSVNFQILPTLNCNFRCSYCYQRDSHRKGVMNEEIADWVYKTIDSEILSTTTNLNIAWFGGEPLLAIKVIQNLSKKILERIEGTDIEYFSPMVTNGYLLNDRNIEILKRCRISHLQVTLDGLEAIHDQRRILANGGGTFRVILNNIKSALKSGIQVSIRINIDKNNISSIPGLLTLLEVEGISPQARIGIGAVSKFNSVCESISDCLLDKSGLETFFSNPTIKQLISHPSNLIRMVPNFVGCVATAKRSLIIGPVGELYKCSKTIGQEKDQCGHIASNEFTHPNILKWTQCSRFDRTQCLDCSMIPICSGDGCAYHYVMLGYQDGQCDQEKNKASHHAHIFKLYKNEQP